MSAVVLQENGEMLYIDNDTQQSHMNEHQVFNLTEEEKAFAQTNNIVYYSLLMPVAICGNIFTLSAVFMVLKIKKSIPNMLIGVLAFADLTSVLTCHVIAIVNMSRPKWIGDNNLCRFQSVMAFTYFKLGFFSKTCISIDRLIALKYPLKYRSIVTTKRVACVIIFNILFSIGSSALTWLVDGEYIMQLETWNMCTNDFSIPTDYKLAIVISEGTVFLVGVLIFFVGNITVIRVMLQLGSKMKKLKESNGTLNKLKLMPLSVVTSASVGFTDMKNIPETTERDDSADNNNEHEFDFDDCEELNTPLSKRAREKFNNSANAKPNIHTQPSHTLNRLSAPDHISHRQHSFVNGSQTPGSYQQFAKNNKLSVTSQRYSTTSLPTGGASTEDRERKKSIFKKVVELSSKALARKKESRQKKELQFAKLVMVIVTVFVILWIPYMFTIYYEHSNSKRLHPLIVDISMKLVFANACINPILYGLFNANFRKAYIYYIRMFCFYVTCKASERPDGKNMPWSVVIPATMHQPGNPSTASPARSSRTA